MNFLHSDTLEVLQTFSDALDSECGYPSPGTKTDRAVDIIEHPDGGTWLMEFPDSVYAPAHGEDIDPRVVLPEDRQADEPAATVEAVTVKQDSIAAAAALRSGVVKLGDPPPPLDLQNFVLITADAAKELGYMQ